MTIGLVTIVLAVAAILAVLTIPYLPARFLPNDPRREDPTS